MSRRAYYNEIDRHCCDWLQSLMDAGLITPGKIDDRSIHDVSPADPDGYERVHLCAGIGIWDAALTLAGWRGPVWTASFPCQPFSAAGQRKAGSDERHIWPSGLRLIRECRPGCLIGEQVEGAVRLGWLDRVFADLEGEGYACGATVFGAHSVGAPHIRQRLFWVADAEHAERWSVNIDRQDGRDRPHAGRQETHGESGTREQVRWLADAESRSVERPAQCPNGPEKLGTPGLGDEQNRRLRSPSRLAHGNEPGRSREPDARLQRATVHDADGRGELRGVALAGGHECGTRRDGRADRGREAQPARLRAPLRMGDADEPGPQGHGNAGERADKCAVGSSGGALGLDDTTSPRHDRTIQEAENEARDGPRLRLSGKGCGNDWHSAVWLPCTDGRARPVPQSVFRWLAHARANGLGLDEMPADAGHPLARSFKGRVGALRAFGNAINIECAAEFIRAYLDVTQSGE